MTRGVQLGFFAACFISMAACKVETTNSVPKKSMPESATRSDDAASDKSSTGTSSPDGSDQPIETVQTADDGYIQATLTGKFGKVTDGSYFLEVDQETKVRLDLAKNNITAPAESSDVDVSGYFEQTENGEVFVVETITGKDGSAMSLTKASAARKPLPPKPPVQKSYWRCVGTVVYPLQCISYRSGANGDTKTDATNNALTACKTICPASKNAQCVVPPNSKLFPAGSTVAAFTESMGGCAYYDAAKKRWRR